MKLGPVEWVIVILVFSYLFLGPLWRPYWNQYLLETHGNPDPSPWWVPKQVDE
jgi:hypothetical protein